MMVGMLNSSPNSVANNRVLTSVAVVIFAVSQFLIPLAMLRSPQMTRFSWQMFSRKNGVLDFRVVDQNGGVHNISAKAYLGVIRGDMETERFFPAYVCRRFPGTSRVKWIGVDGKKGEYKCP